ncbi:MAG: hypothetical protein PGN33_27790 [Methylobacterium radiotolerans]
MTSTVRVALAALVTASLAACASAPAACASAPAAQPELTPVPRPRVDAKTQLEYGNPPPPPPGRY